MSAAAPDLALALDRLARGSTLVIVLFEKLPAEVARWRPAPERWSLLEIVNHLADEEVEDFRTRVERTLRDPAQAWPPIAPQEWVLQRAYNERDPAASLERYLAERRASFEWLRSLRAAAWDHVHVHPTLGPMSAGQLLANWVAHDLLHARQMLRVHHEHLAAQVAPASLDYAGRWS